MSKDTRDLLSVLQAELKFLDGGGYYRQAWRPPFFFQDSPACLNYRQVARSVACHECVLAPLIPQESLAEPSACQHIRLTPNASVAELYRTTPLPLLEAKYREWLVAKIHQLETDAMAYAQGTC